MKSNEMTNFESKMMYEMMYEKYNTFLLNQAQMSNEIGTSYSGTCKIFYRFTESQILKSRLLPPWRKVSQRRMWHVKDIIDWISEGFEDEEMRLCSAPPSTKTKSQTNRTPK